MFPTTTVKLFLIASMTALMCFAALAFDTSAQEVPKDVDSATLVYTVQPGDTLTGIALKYNLRLVDIMLTNNIVATAYIYPGQRLVLPGIPVPTPTPLPTPTPWPTPTPVLSMTLTGQPHLVQPGDTIYSVAAQYGVPMGTLVLINNLASTSTLQTGQELQIPGGVLPTPAPASPPFAAVSLSEPVIMQGRTLIISVALAEPATLSGMFEGQPLIFSNSADGQAWAMAAIHALLPANTYPIVLQATRPDGSTITRVETVEVVEGPYGSEHIQLDNQRAALLEADLLAAEREKLVNLWTKTTPRPLWTGSFWYPTAGNITSYFGTRRTYNTSTELSFHSGTDFGGFGTPIYAPAAGTVVLAEPLTVRGNAVVIDHGLGLYSGYWHQNQIAVVEGQQLQPGDLIGYIGNTGLVTGPHLHWEMRLNGIAINPLQWVRETIP